MAKKKTKVAPMTEEAGEPTPWETLQCVYFDQKNQRFAVFHDADLRLSFCYWRELFHHGFSSCADGATLEVVYGQEEGPLHARGVRLRQARLSDNGASSPVEIVRSATLGEEALKAALCATATTPLIFVDCRFENVELSDLNCTREFACFDCHFEGNFKIVDSRFSGSVWCVNSLFRAHFSMKNCTVAGDVHTEGSDFSGSGGVSFRGLKASNLYFDLGVTGSNDMIWLNEMNIDGVLSIGGTFQSEIQILSDQEDLRNTARRSRFGAIVIGSELYVAENANRTTTSNGIVLRSLDIAGPLTTSGLTADFVSIADITASQCYIRKLSTTKDLTIKRSTFAGPEGLLIYQSSIGRHLNLRNNQFMGSVGLDYSSISEVVYMHENVFAEKAALSIEQLTASRFLLTPDDSLFKNARQRILVPKPFALLKSRNVESLGAQYCSLKHWFSDAGKLELEDIAYFHMRECFHRRLLTQLVFGRIFGWGVRLTNVAISSLVLVAMFAVLFLLMDRSLSPDQAIALSAQSFISSFFGEWANYDPSGLVANLVTVESASGVLFITVFIGAYIRKLLR